MPVKTTCPNCDRPYTVADTMAGKMVRCKGCDKAFRVPDAAGAIAEEPVADVVAVPEDDRPRRDRDYDRDDDRPRRRRDEDDAYEPRFRKKGGSTALWVWLSVGGGVLLLIVVVMVLVLTGGGGGGGSGNVTSANYDRITPMMGEDEVVKILGASSTTEAPGADNPFFGFGTVRVWKGGSEYIKVFLVNGKVMGKACKIGIVTRHQTWG